MSPATVRLKRLADKLSEEDAVLLLTVARQLSRRRQREEEDRQDRVDATAALAEPGSKPWGQVKRERGL